MRPQFEMKISNLLSPIDASKVFLNSTHWEYFILGGGVVVQVLFVMNRQIIKSVSNYSTVAGYVHNRNPRNLERLTIAYKPDGWHLEKPGRSYWHKLVLVVSGKNVTATVQHNSGHVPVIASTKEWAIKKHLYSTLDKAAYTNLGRILGRRCLETGITEMQCKLASPEGGKVQLFLNELVNSGISLTETPRYIHPKPSDLLRPEKPWAVD